VAATPRSKRSTLTRSGRRPHASSLEAVTEMFAGLLLQPVELPGDVASDQRRVPPLDISATRNALPLRHLTDGMPDVLVRGKGANALLVPTAALLGFAVALTFAAGKQAWSFGPTIRLELAVHATGRDPSALGAVAGLGRPCQRDVSSRAGPRQCPGGSSPQPWTGARHQQEGTA
jgi:hypothetical protein